MKLLKTFNYLLLLSVLFFNENCSINAPTHYSTQKEDVKEDDSNDTDAPDTVEKIDAFTALVEEYLDDLHKVEQETTDEADDKRGESRVTAYFQGDYAIKWIESAEIEGSIVKETYYLYNLKPIYIDQVVTDSENNIERNIAYMNEGKVLKWVKNGKTMDNENGELGFNLEFERFKN